MTGSTDPGKQKRRVDFVVVAKSHSQEELAAALRCAIAEVESDSTRSRAASVWRVFREGDGNVDLSVLIDDVMRSVELRRRELGGLSSDDSVSMLLRITQYVGDSPIGPGFALDPRAISLLAELRAFVDVDQYWLP